jgi:AcrR family transcriptional regulator
MPSDRRSRKRLATRQGISNAATRLFFERGFDHVTVDEIAAAADVGRMTVFNHFPRKEDMFFDRDEEGARSCAKLCGSVIPASLRSRRYACSLIGWLRNRALRRIFCSEPRLHRDDRGQRNPQGSGQGDT